MHQKFEISSNHSRRNLKIREFAIIDKRLNNVKPDLLRPEDYVLLHEQTYEKQNIVKAIDAGMIALVSALRTPVFYPNADTIEEIAECVIALYEGQTTDPVELFPDKHDKSTAGAE